MKEPKISNHPDPIAREAFNKLYADQARREAERPQIEAEGEAALRRLFKLAQGDTGQCGVIAAFLLGCYNGYRFPFDLTEFRRLDADLFDDCIAVLKMDKTPRREVHKYFEDGGKHFEQMAKDWNLGLENSDS